MKRFIWGIAVGVALVALSTTIYLAQVTIFHRREDTFFYLFQDLAFLPAQVLLVTLIVTGLISRYEKRAMLKKLNMVIGTFYAEAGTGLLRSLVRCDEAAGDLGRVLVVDKEWPAARFAEATTRVRQHPARVRVTPADLEELRNRLQAHRDLLLRLLENPNLLEHDAFTDLLWAVFHLADELALRGDFAVLPESDFKHLAGDVERVYKLLAVEWIGYMKHLKTSYPYLFSLAARTNPFDPTARVEVKA